MRDQNLDALEQCDSCGAWVVVDDDPDEDNDPYECPACGGPVAIEEDDGSVEGYRVQDGLD